MTDTTQTPESAATSERTGQPLALVAFLVCGVLFGTAIAWVNPSWWVRAAGISVGYIAGFGCYVRACSRGPRRR